MPSTWRVRVIDERLLREGIRARLESCDVYSLPPELRRAVTDAIVAENAGFPMVLVDSVVVSHGGVDLEAVVAAVREEAASECC